MCYYYSTLRDREHTVNSAKIHEHSPAVESGTPAIVWGSSGKLVTIVTMTGYHCHCRK
ncbi:MAG: hypothetical protein ACI4WS_11315 [Oscillospiraceae bacterium]